MDEYISREAVLQTLQKANIGGYITERLLKIPSADVQPVKRGHWEISSDGYYPYCSECGFRPKEMSKFCPDCGADMRGDTNE